MSDFKLNPDHKIKCLLIQPLFSAFSFWNYVEGCKHIGAKTPSPPLGLLTVAALLPQHWEFKLLDLNCREFSETDWAWADLVCTGGMLPQQKGLLEIIDRAKRDGKYLACGGPDPSSQPDLYKNAAVVVVGEGESAIPVWLDSWRKGEAYGRFTETEKPDITQSPTPRYDLLNFWNYAQISLQYSRGCPFNCEFCDIIELYGRKPRTKTPEQMTKELDFLKKLGYSGFVDIVDDNFIGNKRNVKRNLLPAMIEWNKKNGHPFFYATEASMNLADDVPLMEAMRDADFRFIFMGIETPDPELLLMTQKSQNTVRPIVERVTALYKYGMVPTAGFIMGFDGEKPGIDRAMIDLIEDCGINMAMVGLLVALPKTQLTRRLLKEGRLMSFSGKLVADEKDLRGSALADKAMVEIVDQTVAGLNFITSRDRIEIFNEYLNVVANIYSPRSYMDRAMKVAARLKSKSKHRPRLFEHIRNTRGFFRISYIMTKDKEMRWLYWRNFFYGLSKGIVVLEQVMRLHGIYSHFRKQSAYLTKAVKQQITDQTELMPMDMRRLNRPLPERVVEVPDAAVRDAM